MTFYPFALKLKANDSEELLELTALKNDEMLIKIGELITSSLVSADQISNINFPSPITSTQIANKQYVDDTAASVLASVSLDDQAFLRLDGSRPMLGNLSVDGYSVTGLREPVALADAATKNYVDSTLSAAIGGLSSTDLGFFMTDGSRPLSGDVDADGYLITNLQSPVNSRDAATKEYVDSLSRLTVVTTTTNYEIKLSDRIVFGDASAQPVFLDLPSAAGQAGLLFNIKRISPGDNDLFVRAAAGETLDGESVIPLLLQWESMTVVSNGVNWHIM